MHTMRIMGLKDAEVFSGENDSYAPPCSVEGESRFLLVPAVPLTALPRVTGSARALHTVLPSPATTLQFDILEGARILEYSRFRNKRSGNSRVALRQNAKESFRNAKQCFRVAPF